MKCRSEVAFRKSNFAYVCVICVVLVLIMTPVSVEETGKEPEVRLKVLTLNCWGVPGPGSRDRLLRFELIGRKLAQGAHDVLLLEEVWMPSDYQTLVQHLNQTYPYFHYFYSGIVGTGCCMFSKLKIVDVLMHQYSLNGYVHKLMHCDFLAAKAVNGAILEKDGVRVAAFFTHIHAEYDRDDDEYIAHRVAQAYELSQILRWSAGVADVQILGGDLNFEPVDLGYRLVRENAGLKDAWLTCDQQNGGQSNEEGNTCDIPVNSYVDPKLLERWPKGKRIDFLMYRTTRSGFSMKCQECSVFLGKGNDSKNRVVSFSDHEGVEAEFLITKKTDSDDEPSSNDDLKDVLMEAMMKLRLGLSKVDSDRVFCLSIIVIVIVSLFLCFTTDGFHRSLVYIPTFATKSVVGGAMHKLLWFILFSCLIHILIISTFEKSALVANIEAVEVRLKQLLTE